MKRTDIINITDIQRYSVHDGPGIRTVVFFKGCPLNCLWCQNPETQTVVGELAIFIDRCIGCGSCVNACPENAITLNKNILNTDKNLCKACGACEKVCYSDCRCIYGKTMPVAEIFDVVVRDKVFYRNSNGGVTLSGGEPLSQAKAAVKLLNLLKTEKIQTAIETCGHGNEDDFQRILDFTDVVLFDLKLMDPKRHTIFTGLSNEQILKNLKLAATADSCLIIRVPLIPDINDDEENLKMTARQAVQVKAKEVHLLGFHQAGRSKWEALGKTYRFASMKGPDSARMNEAKSIFETEGLKVTIGGG